MILFNRIKKQMNVWECNKTAIDPYDKNGIELDEEDFKWIINRENQ